jgi:acyl-CoA thioesterase
MIETGEQKRMAEKNIAIDLDNPNIAFSMKMVETNPFMQWNGIAVEELDEDHCVCAMELRPEQTNPNDYAHGGVLFTIADVTASALARADGRNYSTLDSDVHFLRNVKEGRIVGEASIIRRGKTSVVVETVIRAEDGKELARVTVTMFCISQGIHSQTNQ